LALTGLVSDYSDEQIVKRYDRADTATVSIVNRRKSRDDGIHGALSFSKAIPVHALCAGVVQVFNQ